MENKINAIKDNLPLSIENRCRKVFFCWILSLMVSLWGNWALLPSLQGVADGTCFSLLLYFHLYYVFMFNAAFSILQCLFISFHSAVFKDLINTEINNNSRIVVIATSKSHDSLHPSLLTSQGCHVFQCRAEIHPPDADQRQQILSAMMARLFRHRDRDILELRWR